MKQFLLLIFLLSLLACSPSKEILIADNYFENEFLDTLVVRAKKIKKAEKRIAPLYHPTTTRSIDLIHSALQISFNWEKRMVVGHADLTCKAYFYPIDQVKLDAVNFQIDGIGILKGGVSKVLQYEYDSSELIVFLDRIYSRDEEFILNIDYQVQPGLDSSNRPYAIGSDQGLFFIDPDDIDPEKPTQIWTQGETQYNSRWFPTIDHPNEHCTQELAVRVDDRFISLSNGILTHSEKHHDNTRTDHWKLDLPHAPYLFSLVVGDFSEVTDMWKGKELGYYVYPEYEESAREIFKHTPEMLSFFSNITGVEYPWPSYKQVIVEDFVSGAMENTTCVVFAKSFQKSREELVDHPNDMIVAHEMFHHWFGNLVSCESWANLTLNEGFANYAEYLWMEYKYGLEEAELYRDTEMGQYISSSQYNSHPLIYFGYDDQDAMFDAHSYNKGGLVLHMLRNYLGDEAFFVGLNKYLTDHQFSSAEAHDLRLAFESVCGEDLNWFFNQWFYAEGYPKLKVSKQYDEEEGFLNITVDQVQSEDGFLEYFQAPIEIQLFFNDGSSKKEIVWLENVHDEYKLAVEEEPLAVLFNSDNNLICTIESNFSAEQYAAFYLGDAHVVSRYESLYGLKYHRDYSYIFTKALADPVSKIRSVALGQLSAPIDKDLMGKIRNLALTDPSPKVRSKALRILKEYRNGLDLRLVESVISQDSSASVLAICLNWIGEVDIHLAERYAEKLENKQALMIQMAVGDVYAKTGKGEHLKFFESKLLKANMYQLVPIISSYKKLLFNQEAEVVMAYFNWLYDNSSKLELNYYRKNLFRTALYDKINFLKNQGKWVKEIEEMEQKMSSYQLGS